MFCFSCENIHKKKTYAHLVSGLHKMKSSNACDELPFKTNIKTNL